MIRNASIPRLLIAVLATTMLAVALACASEEPTAAPTPAPTATSPSMPDGEPTATPVMSPDTELPWMDRYLESPGYDPEWGQPIKGGTFIFGAREITRRSTPTTRAAATITAVTSDSRGTPCSALTPGQVTLRP